jgi:hypothetical protein
MDTLTKKSQVDNLDLLRLKESAMEPTDPICRTAESPDGTIKTQSAEEDQAKRRKEIASIDQVPSLRLKESAMEPMDPTCRTAESPDGTIKTQSAEEDQVKRRKETASIDQVPLLRLNQKTNHPHCHSAMDSMGQLMLDQFAEFRLTSKLCPSIFTPQSPALTDSKKTASQPALSL